VVDKRNKRSVWSIPSKGFKEAHYATFPPELITPCILAGSRQGDAVLDPFGGTFTAAIVAKNLGRKYVMIELSPEYLEMGTRRYKRETAQLTFLSGERS
jgi:DNA modification methylase